MAAFESPDQPQSMQGAGIAPPDNDPAQLLKALSMGTPLQGSPIQQFQANPDNVNWTGLAGFGAGLMGQPNPVITQLLAQQETDRRQRALTFHVMEAVQRNRRLQQEDRLKMLDDLSKSNTMDARRLGWEGKAKLYAQQGVQISPSIIEGLSNKTIDHTRLKSLAEQLTFLPLERVLALNQDVNPADIQELVRNKDNPGFRKFAGLPTVEDEQKSQLELASKEEDLISKRYGLEDHKIAAAVRSAHMQQTGKPFSEGTPASKQAALTAGMALSTPPTNTAKMALEEFGPQLGIPLDTKDPVQINKVVNLYRAKRQKEMLDRAAVQGQLTQVGGAFKTELDRVNQQMDKFNTLNVLINDMDRLVDEGQKLGLTNNPKMLNAVQQEIKSWTGGPKSKAAQWLAAFETLDARFANAAQAIEGITGNRLAVDNARKALAFHPKASEPYGTQRRRIAELKNAAAGIQSGLHDDLARALRGFESAAGRAGVPFVIGNQGNTAGWSAEPEEQ